MSRRKQEAVKPPAEEEWESQKALMHQLYYEGTLPKLIHTMESEYGFVASKNQYERRLKAWGFRKNVKSEDWGLVLHKNCKRDALGKKSQIVLEGAVISPKKIKKVQQRFSLAQLQEMTNQRRDAPSPPGFTVSTPPEMETIYQTIFRTRLIPFDNLPSNILRDFFATQAMRNPISQHEVHHKNYLFYELGDRHISGLQSCSTGDEQALSPGRDVCSIETFNFGHLWYGREHSLSTFKQLAYFDLQRSTLGLGDWELENQLERLFAPNEILEFLKSVVHFASNNLFTFNGKYQVLEWITSQSDPFLKRIFAIELQAIQACWDTLLGIAIEERKSESFRVLVRAASSKALIARRLGSILHGALELDFDDIVEEILKTGFDVNTTFIWQEWGYGLKCPRTYLGAARTATAARLLLNRGADVDALNYWSNNKVRLPAIYRAVERGGSDLLQVFLDYSAKFDPNFIDGRGISLLGYAVEKQDIHSVNLLLAHGAQCQDILQPFFPDGKWPYFRPLRTELQQAAFSGDKDIVAALLATQSGRAILRTGEYKWTPLRDAALAGNTKIVEMLISAGADINAIGVQSTQDDESYEGPVLRYHPSTALFAAIQNHHLGVVQLLLPSRGVDLKTLAPDEYGRNALEFAEALRYCDIVSFLRTSTAHVPEQNLVLEMYKCGLDGDIQSAQDLIAEGVNACHLLDAVPTIPTHFSTTSLYLQYQEEKTLATEKILSVFIAVGGDPNIAGPRFHKLALQIAGDAWAFDICRQLVFQGARLDVLFPEHGSILQLVTEPPHGDKWDDLIRLLVEHGASAKEPATKVYGTALQNAAFYGKIDIMGLLLKAGADVNSAGPRAGGEVKTALETAVRSFHRESLVVQMLKLLIEYGANVKNITMALTRAIREQQSEEVIRLLLDNGADVNSSDALQVAFGSSVLEAPDLGIINLLLERGADINGTALQCAARCGHLEIAKMLIVRGADINALSYHKAGWTALQMAAWYGQLKMAHFLLERGADPNVAASGVEGTTALERAAEWGRLDMVRLLLNAGASPTESAVDLAFAGNHFVIAQIIQDEIKTEKDRNDGKAVEIEHQADFAESLEQDTGFGKMPDFDLLLGGQVSDIDDMGHIMEDSFPQTLAANDRATKNLPSDEVYTVMGVSTDEDVNGTLGMTSFENDYFYDASTDIYGAGESTFASSSILPTLDPEFPQEGDGLSSTLPQGGQSLEVDSDMWDKYFELVDTETGSVRSTED